MMFVVTLLLVSSISFNSISNYGVAANSTTESGVDDVQREQRRRQNVDIRELLELSGQQLNTFTEPLNNPNNYPEIHPSNAPASIDYDSNLYKQLISARPAKRRPVPEIVMQEKTIDNLLSFVKGAILCGGDGWCGNRCCATNRVPAKLQLRPAGLRRKPKLCYPVCQPACTAKCIEAARVLMQAQNGDGLKLGLGLGLGATGTTEGEKTPSLVSSIPLCRPACMPACRESCLRKKQRPMKVTCRPACMPHCTPTCVASPPLMVPCMDGTGAECHCPPGYVQCSKYTCCMRYRTMAVRYRKLLPGYLYADNGTLANATSTSTTTPSPDGLLASTNITETLSSAGQLFSSFTSLLRPSNGTLLDSAAAAAANRGANASSPPAAVSTGAASVDYEVVYDYDENTDAGKAEFDAVTTLP